MSKYRTLAVIFSILLAVGAPLLMGFQSHKERTSYPSIRVDIEPYDPRDLMYGHYLNFRIKWNLADQAATQRACHGENCCLCLGGGGVNPPAMLGTCEAKTQTAAHCQHVLKGEYRGGDTFDVGINRYYVDENHALPLEHLFRDKKETFSVSLGLKPDGKAVLLDLYVGDKILHDYIAANDGVVPQAVKPDNAP